MNEEDKSEYHETIVKNMTRKCHQKCYKENIIDKTCVSSCYHKYINVISKLRKLSLKKGEEVESEFVLTGYGLRENPMLDLIWSKGGSKIMPPLFISMSLRSMIGITAYPYKGYSPFRDNLENQ